MVLVEIWPYFHSFCLGNKGQENMFYNILERKKRLSWLQRQEVEKVGKLPFFLLVYGFGQKLAIFLCFF